MHSDAQLTAKRNIRSGHHLTHYQQMRSQDISFTRPSVSRGYGAILTCLDSLGPARKCKINSILGVKPNYLSTTYFRLVGGGLVARCAKGYKITRLGRAYVNQWLGSDPH